MSVVCKLGLGNEFNIDFSVTSFDCCCRTIVDVVKGTIVFPRAGLIKIFANKDNGGAIDEEGQRKKV